MNAPFSKLIALGGVCLILVGCAQTGVPLPPSLELPKPPTDLRAFRKGSKVTLTWTEPTRTTDRQSVRDLGPTMICRSAGEEMTTCGNAVEILPPPPAMAPRKYRQKSHPDSTVPLPPLTYTDTLPVSVQSDNPDADVTYAVEVLNRNARGADLSNRVQVPAIATLPAPADLAATLSDDGVTLTWTTSGEPSPKPGVQYRYRIYRRTESPGYEADVAKSSGGESLGTVKTGSTKDGVKPKDTIAGEVPVGPPGSVRFVDPIEWEKTYLYRIAAVTIITRAGGELQIEGDDSPVLRIVAHDIYPPSVPAGLQAAYSGEGQKPFIDLIWAPVTSADLEGYNVYRSEAGSQPAKVNSEVVKSPSYRDTAVTPGKTYLYSVSAVDVRGNESAKSDEASEAVPSSP